MKPVFKAAWGATFIHPFKVLLSAFSVLGTIVGARSCPALERTQVWHPDAS